jgi:hypothetical protein
MNTDPNEIQKLTERVEALEKFKKEALTREMYTWIGRAVLIIGLFVIAERMRR